MDLIGLLILVVSLASPAWLIGLLKLLDWHTARSKTWNEV